FAVLGYPQRKAGPLRELLSQYADSALTLVIFESPHRIGKLLAGCSDALGERRYAICRELTKLHQQVWRASLPDAPTEEQLPRKGEVTLVIEGRRKAPTERAGV
ncbi:MAG: 16S rRNA (cytidine(1402)-2'-O)-methyltransferase, partial [Armatimonadetes bacterium]|nr:16S rRNA (cytidine(1402)-2'-O)-methyltransferase [Armatimonadota bacterium]